MSKPNKRRLGQGMKPRVAPTAIEATVEAQVASADAGQPEDQEQPSGEALEAVETGGRLDADSVQNLESAEDPYVARKALDDLILKSAQEQADRAAAEWTPEKATKVLDNILRPFGMAFDGVTGADKQNTYGGIERATLPADINKTPNFAHISEISEVDPEVLAKLEADVLNHGKASIATFSSVDLEDPAPMKEDGAVRKALVEQLGGALHAATSEEGEKRNAELFHGAIGIDVSGLDRNKLAPRLGQRPDGTFGLVVTIPEGYIEPIRQQAESDKQTAEEWVSTRLQEMMDTWWQPAESR